MENNSLIDQYLEMKRELNYQKTVNHLQNGVIEIQKQYIAGQDKMMVVYVNRLKEYAKMLESREVAMHEMIDCMTIKDKLQIMQNFIGEMPNRIN